HRPPPPRAHTWVRHRSPCHLLPTADATLPCVARGPRAPGRYQRPATCRAQGRAVARYLRGLGGSACVPRLGYGSSAQEGVDEANAVLAQVAIAVARLVPEAGTDYDMDPKNRLAGRA